MIQKYVTQAHSHWSFCGITVMAQLKEMITEAHSRPDVKAIVIKGATFCLLFWLTTTAYSVLVQVEM